MTKFQGVTVFRNPKAKTWYARKRIDGRQVYISGKSQRKVIEKLKRLLKIEEKKKPEGYTLASWYEKWLQLFKVNLVKQATINDYECTLKNVPEDILDKKLDQITTIDIIILLNNIEKERVRQKTYELLNMLFDKAYKMEVLRKNVMDKIEKPKHVREKGMVLTDQEQRAFLTACENSQYANLFKVLLWQGLRIGEALALTGNDIDWVNKTINIDKAIAGGHLDTTKNKQSVRKVPMFHNTEELLSRSYSSLKAERLFDFLYSACQRNFKSIVERANLSNKLSIHDLRHTFITNCKNKNIPEHIIQHWVGHEIGSKVTSSIYTHVTNEANLLYISKFEE